VVAGVLAAGIALWILHARALDLGGGTPVLGYEAAQHAIAARELAERGRLASLFAPPIELIRHPQPPWPLSSVEPGLVAVEAGFERLVPRALSLPGGGRPFATPAGREWLSLILPLASYLILPIWLALRCRALIASRAPASERSSVWAGAILALVFLLDPESQHYAASGVPKLPFALGTIAALIEVASGTAGRRPFRSGLLLGLTGSFGAASMTWVAPWFAVAAALLATPGARLRASALVLAGYSIPMAPWWIYQWRSWGAPFADSSRWMLWDGVEGRTWFSMLHLPESPLVPHGAQAWALIGEKVRGNLGPLLLSLVSGPRALWIGALGVWLATRPPRPLALAGGLVLVQAALGILGAAASLPALPTLFPARLSLEAAGLLATWALVRRLPEGSTIPGGSRWLPAAVAALALGWGVWLCSVGWTHARASSVERGIPAASTLADLAERFDRELSQGEPVMSNLGPILAFHARRPVLHLALAPDVVEECRMRLTFTHVVLVFRDASRSWPEWRGVMESASELNRPESNVARVRRWRSPDGFSIVWLELGPPRARLARAQAGDPPRKRCGAAPKPYLGMTRGEGASSPSSSRGYSGGSSRKLSTNTGTSAESRSSASGPSATRTTS
jgi:hypothetical protein